MDILYGTKINQLLANTAPTGLLFADWLKKKGYSVQLQKKYRDSGWLTAICKGVMCRTGARLNAYDAIASYNKQMGGTLRVAAMSALEYTGFNHYVPMGKPVLMVAAPTHCPCGVHRVPKRWAIFGHLLQVGGFAIMHDAS